WSHLDLDAWSDPRLKNAQKEYNEAMAGVAKGRMSVKQSADNLLINISREVTDYYRQQRRTGKERRPPPLEIAAHLRANYLDLPGPKIGELAQKISQILYKDGEPARAPRCSCGGSGW
ncbi:unnamed protein product, partial [marine sediment metagenome]